MPIAVADIGMFLTGGSTNANVNLSLGGNISNIEVVSDKTSNLFRRITDSEASSGITLYRCVAIKNKSLTDTMSNVVFYMVQDTTSPDDLALYSYAQADKNQVETAVVSEITAPVGGKINFIAALNRSGGLQLGNLAPGDYINIWLRISVNPGAVQISDNLFKVRCEVNGTAAGGGDGGGGTGGGGPPPPDDSGVNFAVAALGDTSTNGTFTGIVGKIKKRGGSKVFIVYNGDLSYSSSMGGWLKATADTRSFSTVSFGNHDVDDGDGSKTTINDLKNAYSLPATYYSKIYQTVGIVVMESGENHSVPENTSSDQFKKTEDALKSLSTNPAIEWIMVFNHYPIYGPNSHHPNETDTRDWYDPLFDKYGVDIVVTSHNHNLWHSKLIAYNSSSPNSPVTSGTDPNYAYNRATKNHGKIYCGSGAGGKMGSYDIKTPLPNYIAFGKDKTPGYLYMELSNSGKTLTGKFYDDSDKLLKQFVVSHL